MKKTGIVVALAIIALSATQVMAQKLDVAEELKQKQTLIIYEAQKKEELPDYKSLNQQFIDKLEKAAAESEYQTIKEWPEYNGTFIPYTRPHPPIKEVYDKVLNAYKELLNALNTMEEYNEENRWEIEDLFRNLDVSIEDISSDERQEYVDFLCHQDKYFLKAENAIVNMAFFASKPHWAYMVQRYKDLFSCVAFEEQEKYTLLKSQEIKVKTFWKTFWESLNSINLEEVGEGFKAIEDQGSY